MMCTLTREALVIDVDRRIKGQQVGEAIDQIPSIPSFPRPIRVDIGVELITKATYRQGYENGLKLVFSRPGKANEQAFLEPLNSLLRGGWLNTQWLLLL